MFQGINFRIAALSSSSELAAFFACLALMIHQTSPTRPLNETTAPPQIRKSIKSPVFLVSMWGSSNSYTLQVKACLHGTFAVDRCGEHQKLIEAQMDDQVDSSYRVTADELRQFVERYERLEIEKKDIADQQKEIMAEAKGRGYDTKVLRKIVALRKRDLNDIAEEEAVLAMYKEALGMH
jgi:uncharacterized protein (UPF0335 family)